MNDNFEIRVANAKRQLQDGADPEDIFDWVGDFSEGFAVVKLDGWFNFINTNNNILREDFWFDNAKNFHEGFARVRGIGGWNFIDTDGNFLRDDFSLDYVQDFYEGYAVVRKRGKYNFIDTDGRLFEWWFDDAFNFHNGFAQVKYGSELYQIDTNGDVYDRKNNFVRKIRKRVVRLTESQLRNTIKSVITQYLNESRRR